MLELFTVSCDTGFAQLGLGVGAPGLADEAMSFGWDQYPPARPARGRESYFPPVSSFRYDLAALAKSAIGQESVQATPLTLALDASARRERWRDHDATPTRRPSRGSQGQTVGPTIPSRG